MKKTKLIFVYIFLFSIISSCLFAFVSHLYIKESTQTLLRTEIAISDSFLSKHILKTYSIKEFQKSILSNKFFLEYKTAIFSKDNKLFFTTFKKVPQVDDNYLYRYNMVNCYAKDNKNIICKTSRSFFNLKKSKIMFQRNIDFSEINNKKIILYTSSFLIFLLSFILLYFPISAIRTSIINDINIFFNNAIHEIRTPLGVILINLEMLEAINNKQKPLQRALAASKNLISVYESVEYYIKHKRVDYLTEKINLSNFLKNRVDLFISLAKMKNIDFKYEIQDNLLIDFNRIELTRLIDNNLSNAIKYSTNNKHVTVELKKISNYYKLSFTNNSNKINNLSKIFLRYYRENSSQGGFGLGLNIIKHICEKYDIDIEVNQNENNDATFSYRILSKNEKN